MAEFAYINAKNTSTSYMSFQLHCRYHPRVSYKENLDPCSKSKSVEELFSELWKLMILCQQNFHHAQELQKQAYDKGVKPQNYTPGDKFWLNSKQLKTKWNRNLKVKFLGLFQALYPVDK